MKRRLGSGNELLRVPRSQRRNRSTTTNHSASSVCQKRRDFAKLSMKTGGEENNDSGD